MIAGKLTPENKLFLMLGIADGSRGEGKEKEAFSVGLSGRTVLVLMRGRYVQFTLEDLVSEAVRVLNENKVPIKEKDE